MIYLIRHGQTEGNAAKLLQGRRDIPLNEVGIEQARVAGTHLADKGIRITRVFTSPLGRAAHTGQLVAPGVEQVVDERLIEMEYGPYEGSSLENMAPEVLEFFRDFEHNPAPAGMEQLSDIVERLGSFLESIRDIAASEEILVCTHAIALKGALEYLTPDSHGSYWSKYIGNCAIYATGVDPDGEWIVPYAIYE